MGKYNAALLLNSRLFQTPEDTQDFLKHVDKSAFGTYNRSFWKKITKWSNARLQNYVRDAFHTSGRSFEEPSESYRSFKASVVTPCIRINVGAVDDAMARLSAQLVRAIASQQLTEAQIMLL